MTMLVPSDIHTAHQIPMAAPAGADSPRGPEFSVVVPTFNEKDNVERLVVLLRQALHHIDWEVIFVDDDSPDRTADVVRNLAMKDRRVRCLQRLGRRGLSSACLEGLLATSAPYVAVMDGDLQHDERLLAQMLTELRTHDIDIVVGSRYTEGADLGQWSRARAMASRIATRLSVSLVPPELSDPMSGFFALRRDVFERIVRRTSGLGFKLLLDFFASSPRPLRFKELPYQFRTRQAGESKADSQVAWDYLMLLLDKHVGHLIPVRVVAFSLVGGLGVLVHIAVLFLCFRWLNISFVASQAGAALAAMTSNFALNNLITYHDRRLHGWQWLRGWVSFVLVCSVGAFANVGVAAYLFNNDYFWGLSAVTGILVGTVWNYAVTSAYTWKAAA
jgi:dolichol-phosphate mannosyltransferase